MYQGGSLLAECMANGRIAGRSEAAEKTWDSYQLGQKSSIHASALFAYFSEKEVGCNACHKAHQESVLLCNQCDTFDQKVP
jgi:hypothetical protein